LKTKRKYVDMSFGQAAIMDIYRVKKGPADKAGPFRLLFQTHPDDPGGGADGRHKGINIVD
jgi:hypothetical protein